MAEFLICHPERSEVRSGVSGEDTSTLSSRAQRGICFLSVGARFHTVGQIFLRCHPERSEGPAFICVRPSQSFRHSERSEESLFDQNSRRDPHSIDVFGRYDARATLLFSPVSTRMSVKSESKFAAQRYTFRSNTVFLMRLIRVACSSSLNSNAWKMQFAIWSTS